MKQKKFKTAWNADEFDIPLEYNEEPSMTVPDQSMSVREIMDRFARGLPVSGHKVPVYDGEEDLPDMKKLDLSERAEMIEANAALIKEMQGQLQKDKIEYEAERKRQASRKSSKDDSEREDQVESDDVDSGNSRKKSNDKKS